MRTIIAGSRTITDYSKVVDAVARSGFNIREVICGCARGVDLLGLKYAKENDIAYTLFPADWNKFGRSAGYIRNKDMAEYADSLIALWDGTSRGTQHMINLARTHGLDVFIA